MSYNEMEKNVKYKISSFRALEMQELDRKRISTEIHDTTVQNLTTLVHKTEYVTKLMDKDAVGAKLELAAMTDIIRSSIDELREIIYDLRPMSIDDLGLIATVERYINQFRLESNGLTYYFEVENEENKSILPIINLTIFRIIQEALVNVRKHASAERVSVKIVYEPKFIQIEIKDNGVGFDVTACDKKRKHFGLSIMNERVKLLSGKINIASKKKEGTKIDLEIPILEEKTYDTN